MTVFIASLFLPYTVSFDTNPTHTDSDTVEPYEKQDGSTPIGYFSLPRSSSTEKHKALSIPLTPGATTEIEKIFVREAPGTLATKLRLPSSHSSTSLRSLIRPEPHSPSWGRTFDNKQPASRAEPSPPVSILKHNAVVTHSPPNISSLKLQNTGTKRAPTNQERRFSDCNYTIEPCILGNGGLVSAIDAASDKGLLSEKTWVGTIGIPTDALDEHTKSSIAERLEDDFEALAVFVDDNDLNGHYENYCRTILWPVLHYQIPDHPKSKAYEDRSWIFYVRVNKAFADRIIKNWKRGDIIWVHDYHLLLVPGMIRKQLPDAQIGFYLHTAFPSSEIFRCLAVRSDLLEGLLGANMVGFQIEEYVHHFLQTCGRLLNVEATKDGIILEDGRLVHVGTFPMGIDPPTVELKRGNDEVKSWIDTILEKYAGKKLIVARDKLDNIRGVRQKLLAYELFLNECPEYKGQIVLIQIATSSTEDPELSALIAEVATRINSVHSTLAHQPLVFLKQDINYSQWLALLTVANGLMITSLREGMNLTGHEFIVCQDGTVGNGKHAPLIVSEFTGSAALLKDAAVLVNPWDMRQCARSIKRVLDMPVREKQIRWEKIIETIKEHDAIDWYQSYMSALDHAYKDHSVRDATSVPRLSFSTLQKKYENAFERLLILDYEGTLAAWGSPTDIVLTTPKKAVDVLNDLIEDQKNTVYVMSSRRPEEMENLFDHVPGLGLIAENGAYLMEPGTNEWSELVDTSHVSEWKTGVKNILKYYEERIEGSKVEELNSALIFKYDGARDKAAAFKQAGECANHLNDACSRQNVHAMPIDDGLCISDVEVNKSSATQLIGDSLLDRSFRKDLPLPEFLLVMGDSREDEFVFDWAHEMGRKGVRDVVTVSVGQRNTIASCTLTQGVTGVISTLQKLAGQLSTTEKRPSRQSE